MTEQKESYLFQHLDEAYLQERAKFEQARSSATNFELYQRIRDIIDPQTQNSSDNISLKSGHRITKESITITVAGLEYAGYLLPGERVLVKSTDWIPCGQKKVDGRDINFSVKFNSVDFVKDDLEAHQKRPGPIIIEGQLIDEDSVSAKLRIASLGENNDGSMQLLYGFGSEIPYGSEDYQEVERIVGLAERI